MFNKSVLARVSWLAVGLVAGVLGTAALPAEIVDNTATAAAAAELPAPASGPGHGDYCRVAGQGVYFYGRDFDLGTGGYRGFRRWCQRNGGQIGWVE